MQRLLLTILLVSFFAPPALAQHAGAISGTVRTQSGAPVEGLNVSIPQTTHGDVTGEDGSFRIEGVPAGRQTLVVSGVGYEAKERLVSVRANRVTQLQLEISPSVLTLQEVNVAGRRASFEESYLISKSSAAVDGETASDFNAANNYDALRLVPGVSYMDGAGGRHGAPSRIRGGSAWTIPDVIGDFPSLRAAGIGAEDGGLTAGLGASIPAVALQQLEVNKGSLGVLYGEGADGGVIVNEIERGHPGDPSGTLLAEINPTFEQLYMGDIGGGTETVDYYVAAKLLDGNYQDMMDAQGRSLKQDHFYSGLAKIGYNPRPDMRLELLALNGQDQINYTLAQPDDPETEDLNESLALPPTEFETTNTNQLYGVTFDHTLTEVLGYEVGYNYYYTKALRFSLSENLAHRNRPQRSHTVFGNAYIDRSLAGEIDYSGKLGVEAINHLQKEHASGSHKRQQFSDYSAFYANTLSYADRLFVNGGVRYTYARDDFDEHQMLVYDAGLAYEVAPTDTRLRASYSTGYSRNKGFAYFFGPIGEAGGVRLSENQTLEAGLDQRYAVYSDAFEGLIRLTAFRTLNDDVPTFSGWGDQVVYYESRSVRGLEAWLDQQLYDRVHLLGSFTYLHTEVTSTTHPDGINVGNTGVRVPRYTGAVGLSVRPSDDIMLRLMGTYDDGMRSRTINQQTGEVTITTHSSYSRVNLATSYEVNDRLAIQLRVENVLDQKKLGASYEVIGPDGYTYTETSADDPGRFISLGATLNY